MPQCQDYSNDAGTQAIWGSHSYKNRVDWLLLNCTDALQRDNEKLRAVNG